MLTLRSACMRSAVCKAPRNQVSGAIARPLPQVYAGDTAELLHNLTQGGLQTRTASDVQLCAAYLQSKSGGGTVNDSGNAIGNGSFSWAGAAANISRSGSMWQNLLDAGESQ